MDLEADQIREIADNVALLPDHKRVMVDARKWRAERLNRRQYGAKVEHELTTPDAALETGRLPAGISFLADAVPGGQGQPG
jgi:hypothetical protein